MTVTVLEASSEAQAYAFAPQDEVGGLDQATRSVRPRTPMPRREPERTCIVTRETRGPGEMIRFVLSPEGEVVPDLRHKLPGRGAWVTATAEAVSTAVRKRLFSRAFKTEARAAPDLPQRLEALLLSDLRQALALANKAGCVVTGFGKVEDAIASGEARALIHAVEAQPDGRRKLAQALRKRLGDAIWSVPVIDALSHDELGLALGRSHVIHAALVAGAGSDGFLTRWRLLSAYRGTPTGQQADAVGTAVSEQDPAGLPRGAGANDET